jgi:hypothetical protein
VGIFPCITSKPFQLIDASRIAEYHLMPGPREDRAELAAHQPGTENADPHALSFL